MIFRGFEWDEWNREKSLQKHGVTCEESEECFLNFNIAFMDEIHSTGGEERFVMLGETNAGKKLFIAFTMREEMVRIISARPMHKKEMAFYEGEKEKAGQR